jgi:predicted acyl esterase
MTSSTNAPLALIEDPDLGIMMSDGCRLSARIWRPENAEGAPVPVILEYLPYRKRDGTTARDALTHPWFAERGYACVRVDMRGNGDSQGIMEDEYTPLEQTDCIEVINWLASMDCKLRRMRPNRLRRSSRYVQPWTVLPTTFITRAAAC